MPFISKKVRDKDAVLWDWIGIIFPSTNTPINDFFGKFQPLRTPAKKQNIHIIFIDLSPNFYTTIFTTFARKNYQFFKKIHLIIQYRFYL